MRLNKCSQLQLLLFVLAFVFCSSYLAYAQGSIFRNLSKESTLLPSDSPIQMSAEHLSFKYETNIYTARGNVTVSQGGVRLRADSISYDGNTGSITAMGKVIARFGGDVIEADKITLNLPTTTGVIFNGKLLLTKHNIYLEGKKLEKTGHSTYRVEEGAFTTCNGSTPDWRIRGKDLDVSIEGYGTLRHGFFYIKDIPVMYVPWLIYPAKRIRQSGFLMPTIANSSLRGLDLRFPLFLNISPSVDATIVPRICTHRAAQAGLELRYFPYEDFQGRFYGEYTYDWRYGEGPNRKNNRFYLTWRHDQEFDGQLRLKANGSWVSDRDYFEFWGGRFDKRLRIRYLESNAVAYRQFDNFLVLAEARHFDNLDLPNNSVTVQNIPIVIATMFNQRIPYTPLFMSSTINYSHFFAPTKHNQWFGSRLGMDLRLSLPVTLGRFLKFEPSMTYYPKGYVADYFQHDKSISSVNSIRTDLYQVNADIFTDLYSIHSGSFLGFERIKHNLRPRVSWTFRPFTGPQKFPNFDETDRMDKASLLTAELRQTLTGKLRPGEYLDFLTFSLLQSYDFENTRKFDDKSGKYLELQQPGWLNTQVELNFKPHTLIDLSAQTEFDPVLGRARRYSLNLGLMDHRGDLFRVVHQFTEDDKREDLNRQTNMNLQVKLTSSLDCFLENQYTHQFNFAYFTSIGINYHPQCWNILLRYSEIREQDPITQRVKDPDQTIFMTLSLQGLGQIYRFSRDWGELMGNAPEQSSLNPK